MYKNGVIHTRSPMDRISPGRLGLRTYDKARAFPGYTLFSTTAFAGTYKAAISFFQTAAQHPY